MSKKNISVFFCSVLLFHSLSYAQSLGSSFGFKSIDSVSRIYNSIDAVFDSTNTRASQRGSIVGLPALFWDASIGAVNSSVRIYGASTRYELTFASGESNPRIGSVSTKHMSEQSVPYISGIDIRGLQSELDGCGKLNCYPKISFAETMQFYEDSDAIFLTISGITRREIFKKNSERGREYSRSGYTKFDSYLSKELRQYLTGGDQIQLSNDSLNGNKIKFVLINEEPRKAIVECLEPDKSLWFMIIKYDESLEKDFEILLSMPIITVGVPLLGLVRSGC